jgi:hypothetical protein
LVFLFINHSSKELSIASKKHTKDNVGDGKEAPKGIPWIFAEIILFFFKKKKKKKKKKKSYHFQT